MFIDREPKEETHTHTHTHTHTYTHIHTHTHTYTHTHTHTQVNYMYTFFFLRCSFFFIIHSALVSRINNLAGYSLPNSYLGIFIYL